jgi:hypothetical protein
MDSVDSVTYHQVKTNEQHPSHCSRHSAVDDFKRKNKREVIRSPAPALILLPVSRLSAHVSAL